MSTPGFVSVIMPARNAAHMLPRTLGALLASDLPRERWELILVDDASTDETAQVGARYADTVVRIPGPQPFGPAYARNRGVDVSRGEFVLFFDADVVVEPTSVRRLVEALEAEPDAGAVFGSYDDRPDAPGFVSQYRNLLHHYHHQRNRGDSDTFWAGAGAVRRDVFEEAGMYDEWHYGRPQIEDIELGGRIRALGHRILLRPEIQVKHLKLWTLKGVVKTDLADRGIPWARLLAHRGDAMASGSLNLRWTEKAATALAWLGALLVLVALVLRDPRWLVGAAACFGVIIAVNRPLLAFFLRVRGFWFALRVVPMLLMYYLLNGISFGSGVFLHQMIGAPLPNPTMDAFAEVGAKRWPPVPNRNRSTWTS